MSDFPVVPVVLTLAALGGLIYLGTRPSKGAADLSEEEKQKIPVLGGTGPAASIRAGTVFTADLSNTLVARDPATNAPNSSFTALGSVDESGVHQGFQAFVKARHSVTGEVVDVPVSTIRGLGPPSTSGYYAFAG